MLNENTNKGISITGGTGFIGNHLINYLSKNNTNNIRVLTRNNNFISENKNIAFIKGDLSSYSSINQLIENQDILINLAYINSDYQANINAIELLVNSCIKYKIKKIIHLSTAIVTGKVNNDIINEDTACMPSNEYEKTKLAIEELLLHLTKDKIELIIIRPTAVFGPGGMNLVKTIESNVYQHWIIKKIRIMLNKYRCLHLVPVQDVVRAIYFLMCSDKKLSGEKFIVSRDDKKNNNYFYIANRIASISNKKKFKKIFIPFAPLFLEITLTFLKKNQVKPHQIYSNKKIKKYGYEFTASFEVSIDEFIKSNITL